MFTNVIVGVDGYDGGRDAIGLGTALGTGRLTLLNAYPADPITTRASLGGYEQLQHDDAVRLLEAARLEAGVAATLAAVPDLSPARALHDAAEGREADLIVIGSAHHGTIGRILLGDVGRAVLHGAPCPVAIAPKRFRSGPPRQVAVGFDGSSEARAALDVATRIAAAEGAALTLYVVWDDAPVPVVAPAGTLAAGEQASSGRRRWAEELLAGTLDGLPDSVAGRVLHGRPSAELGKAARDHDLLVLGSRGWGALRRVALGSTSDRLAHHAECPVLLVPRPTRPPDAPDGAAAAGAAAG